MDYPFETTSQIGQRLSNQLLKKRCDLGKSRTWLSRVSGVVCPTISNFEQTGRCTLHTFLELAEALNLEVKLVEKE